MKCLIVDDDKMFCNAIKDSLSVYFSSIFKKYTIDIVSENFDRIKLDEQYELIFLDIDLKDMNGIDLAKIIRRYMPEKNHIIVFISSRNDLVFESFTVHPFHFVRKSNLDDDMNVFFKLLTNYFKNNLRLITFEFYGRKTGIFQKDILYIESYGHNIAIVTKDNQYEYRATMKETLDLIGTNFVVQIQRSLAIPLSQIDMIEKDEVCMKDGKKYKIGKKYKEYLLEKFKEYLIR